MCIWVCGHGCLLGACVFLGVCMWGGGGCLWVWTSDGHVFMGVGRDMCGHVGVGGLRRVGVDGHEQVGVGGHGQVGGRVCGQSVCRHLCVGVWPCGGVCGHVCGRTGVCGRAGVWGREGGHVSGCILLHSNHSIQFTYLIYRTTDRSCRRSHCKDGI